MFVQRIPFRVVFLAALMAMSSPAVAQNVVLESDLVGSTWSGTETLGSYGNVSFRFLANNKATMIDKDGDTAGTWTRNGDVVTLRIGASIVYTGTVKEKLITGTGTNGTKTWNFTVTNPSAIAGSAWVGSETLAGYGAVSFRINRDGGATMYDKAGATQGNWRRNGDNVTMTFPGSIAYNGAIRDNIMTGNAGNGKLNWQFSVSNFDEIVRNGRELIEKGEYDNALRAYNYAIQVNPKYAPLYAWRCEVHLRTRDFEKALADCDTTIKLDPKVSNGYNTRGLVLRAQGEPEEALKEFNKAIPLNPSDSILYDNRGRAFHDAKKYDEAINDFSTAIKLKSDVAYYYTNRGLSLLWIRGYDRAIDDFSAAIRLQPTAANQNYRATAYIRANRFDEGIADCNSALKFDDKFAPAFANRGAAYFGKKNYVAAIKDCTEAIRLDPKTDRAFYWRSQAYAKTGEKQLAKADYERAVALNPANQQLQIDVEFGGKSIAPVLDRQEARRALRAFEMGSTLTPDRLQEINSLPQPEVPEKVATPIAKETRDMIKNEKLRFDALEVEMVAAAAKFFAAAKLSPAARKAEELDLQWLYGPVSSVKDRFESQDDLGGMRLIGRLIFKDQREMTAIFPVTYFPGIGANRRGHPGVLWGADNFRIAVKMFATGTIRKDYAHQSFSVSNREDGTQAMKPGFNIDTDTGLLVDPYIRQSSLGTRCFDCHAKGTNLNLKGDGYYYGLMKDQNYKKMKGFDGFLKLATELGASKTDVVELEANMKKDPSLLIPVDELGRANEEYWIRRYSEFKKKIR